MLAKLSFSPPLFSLYFCREQGKAITGFKRALHYFVLSLFCPLYCLQNSKTKGCQPSRGEILEGWQPSQRSLRLSNTSWSFVIQK